MPALDDRCPDEWFHHYPNVSPASDEANALRFLYAFGHRVRRFRFGETWVCHPDGIWREEPDSIRSLLYSVVRAELDREVRLMLTAGDPRAVDASAYLARCRSSRSVNGAVPLTGLLRDTYLADHGHQVYVPAQDPDDWFLTVDDPRRVAWDDEVVLLSPDGVTSLGPPAPSMRLRATTGHLRSSTDPERPIPMWETDVLRKFIPADALDFVCLKLGTNLLGAGAKEMRLVQLFGPGANGKGTITKVSIQSLGSYGGEVDARLFASPDSRGESEHRTYVPALLGRRCITNAEELRGAAILNAEVIKALTVGERITFRRMRQNEESLLPQVTPWVATNHKIALAGDSDESMQRRLIHVHMPVTLPKSQLDQSFKDRLLTLHAADICRWHEEQAVRYLASTENGSRLIPIPEILEAQTAAYFEEEDPLGGFTNDCLVETANPRSIATHEAIYQLYLRWRAVNESDRDLPLTRRDLLRLVPTSRFPAGPRTWVGGKLLSTRRVILAEPDAATPFDTTGLTDVQVADLQDALEARMYSWESNNADHYVDVRELELARRAYERKTWSELAAVARNGHL